MTLFRAALLKLGKRPATRITFAILLGLVALIYISLAASLDMIRVSSSEDEAAALAEIFTFPQAYGALASMLVTFAMLAAAAYAGAIAGSEWSWGAFRVAVARGESRVRYVLTTFAGIGLLALIAFVVLFAVGSVLGSVVGGIAGIPGGDPAAPGVATAVPALVLSGWWVVVMAGAIAFAVGFATRSAVMAMVAVVALYFAEQMAGALLPADVLRFAPIFAGTQLVGAAAASAFEEALVPLATVTAYVVVALAGVALVADRVEAA
jgi:hypothetical protein